MEGGRGELGEASIGTSIISQCYTVVRLNIERSCERLSVVERYKNNNKSWEDLSKRGKSGRRRDNSVYKYHLA